VVAGGRDVVLVDVEPHELGTPSIRIGELGEDRLDDPAGPAPRRPEVHDGRALGSEHLLLERLARDLAHS
jgi:hypothetical protein